MAATERRRTTLFYTGRANSFPTDQRRAFTLHVLEGWDVVDIALVQGRSAEEVQADIEVVRRALRERLRRSRRESGVRDATTDNRGSNREP